MFFIALKHAVLQVDVKQAIASYTTSNNLDIGFLLVFSLSQNTGLVH